MPRPKLKRLLKRQTNLRFEDLTLGDLMGLTHVHWRWQHREASLLEHRLTDMEAVEEFCAAHGEAMFDDDGRLKSREPGKRAWAWWPFFSDEERDPSLLEVEQLDRLGLLTDAELAAIRADHNTKGVTNEYHTLPFRRSWGWWRFTSPRPYDWNTPELIQLESMPTVLTDREKFILANLEDIVECRKSNSTGKDTLKYLGFTEDERTYLGLPQLD